MTKSDLGRVATTAIADLQAALRSPGASETEAVAVSSVAPPAGIEELAAALDRHRASLDLPARRVTGRRAHALADFAAEFGDHGTAARWAAGVRPQRWLDQQDPGADLATLARGAAGAQQPTDERRDRPRAIMLPGEPLIDGPRPRCGRGATVICQPGRRLRRPRDHALDQCPGRLRRSRRAARTSPALRHGARRPAAAPSRSSRAPDGELLGSISLMRIAWEHQRGEVGYWLAAPARGHGHATRAVRLICAWGFSARRWSGSTCWPRPAMALTGVASAAASPARRCCAPTCGPRSSAGHGGVRAPGHCPAP